MKNLLLLVFLGQLLASCHKKDEAPFLRFKLIKVELPAETDTTVALDIESNVAWTLSVPAATEWLQLDTTSGQGKATIHLKVAAINTGNQSRTVQLTVSSVNASPSLQAQITVDQASYNVQFITRKTFGGNNIELTGGMAAVPGGGYILAGSTTSDRNGDVRRNHGGADFWVVKLNSAGDTLWTRVLGGSGTDAANAVAVTPEGDYVVVGHTQSDQNGDVGKNHGYYDVWMVKLRSNGDTVWTRTFGGANLEEANAVSVAPDGNILVAGYTQSSNTGDVGPNHGSYDYWILKLTPGGQLIWQKALGGSGVEVAWSVNSTADGGCIVGGYTRSSSSGDVGLNHGEADFWIVRLKNNGDTLWTRLFGGSGDEVAYAVTPATDDNFLIAGYTTSNNNGQVGANHGNDDFWVVKISDNGNMVWAKTLGGADEDDAMDVTATAGGGCIVAGHTTSNNTGDVGHLQGGSDCWVIRLDNNGQRLWAKIFGGSGNESAQKIIAAADGTYVVAADISTGGNGDINTPGHGSNDWWFTKLKDR